MKGKMQVIQENSQETGQMQKDKDQHNYERWEKCLKEAETYPGFVRYRTQRTITLNFEAEWKQNIIKTSSPFSACVLRDKKDQKVQKTSDKIICSI